MYEKVEACPSCKHSKFANFKICQDFSISKESFALVTCEHCNLIFTNPRPSQNHIARYYESDNYISHTNKGNNITNFLYKQVRRITLRQKVNLIRQYTTRLKLLDFGCGTGTFLHYCQSHNFQTHGYEPNQNAATLAAELLKTEIHTDPAQLSAKKKFDVITAWHVIEHVHDLWDTLQLLKKKLETNGYLFVAVPNINSFDAKYYDQYWAAYDVPRHLYHFSQTSFSTLVKKSKLKLIDIHPMKFDAYYVSLLSEKYKTGHSNFYTAFKTGYNSNRSASKTGEYSSLIYVLTK